MESREVKIVELIKSETLFPRCCLRGVEFVESSKAEGLPGAVFLSSRRRNVSWLTNLSHDFS